MSENLEHKIQNRLILNKYYDKSGEILKGYQKLVYQVFK